MLLRLSITAASLTLALAAAAEAPPAPNPTQATVAPQGGLVAPGRSPELEILFTGDVIGYLEPCG
jgi:hypothetical protein